MVPPDNNYGDVLHPETNAAVVKMTGYAVPSTGGAIAPTDTANQALGKLEKNASSHFLDYVSVKRFGAKGDGITDDTASIQNAISYINSQGGGQLYFPKGIYSVSQSIILYANMQLYGEGRNNTIIKLKNNTNLTEIIQLTEKDNVTLKDFTLDCNSNNGTTGNGITFWKSRNNLVSNIKIINAHTIALNMSNVEDSTVEKCFLIGTKVNTVVSFSNDDITFANGNNKILNNTIENGYLDGIIYNTNNGLIDGNTVRKNGLNPTVTAGGIYSNGHTGLTVVNNTIYSNDGNGVDLINCNSITVGDNKCYNNNSAGIMFSGCHDGTIGINICKNNGISPSTNQDDGISVSDGSYGISITGNRCFDEQTTKTQQWGIQVSGTSHDISITGNTCNGNMNAEGINVSSTGANIIVNGNIPFTKSFSSDVPFDFSLASNATMTLVSDNSKITVVEIIDKNMGGYGRFLLRGSSNLVAGLEDPYNLFAITDTGTESAVYYNGTAYVIKNKRGATSYYSYMITFI